MDDKELVEVWRKEFELTVSPQHLHKFPSGTYNCEEVDLMWQGFQRAKRSQPSVVLPKEIQSIVMPSVFNAEDIYTSLTAAGIKYTIEE